MRQLHVFVLRFDWFTGLTGPFVVGHRSNSMMYKAVLNMLNQIREQLHRGTSYEIRTFNPREQYLQIQF